MLHKHWLSLHRREDVGNLLRVPNWTTGVSAGGATLWLEAAVTVAATDETEGLTSRLGPAGLTSGLGPAGLTSALEAASIAGPEWWRTLVALVAAPLCSSLKVASPSSCAASDCDFYTSCLLYTSDAADE